MMRPEFVAFRRGVMMSNRERRLEPHLPPGRIASECKVRLFVRMEEVGRIFAEFEKHLTADYRARIEV